MPGDLPLDLGDLMIRRVRHTDFADIRAIYSHPEVAWYQDWEPMTDEQVAGLLEGQGSLLPGDPGIGLILPVELKAQEKVIGDVVLTITSLDDRQAEIGYCFHPEFRGRGYASRAVHAVLGYAFESLEMQGVRAITDVRNERSWRLLERVGMRREAHLPRNTFVKGDWIDDYLYEMLADEWPGLPTEETT